MKVVICGYLGSGCTEVAEILAGKFGLDILNTSRILGMIKDFEALDRSGEVDIDLIIKNKLEEILRQRDNIIIEGRSAFFLLDRKDVIKVFLNTSFEERVRHVASRRGIPLDEAREDVERSDRDRNSIIKRFFNKDCVSSEDFDFSIRTNAKTFARVADIIADVIKGLSTMHSS
ncbi:MAG: cytidylate kinase family protein [Candidatus Bathyarchaeota archaeon]|nr:cytidylate kinase family protein [Candidatus Bathyarchaeota archaeon]